MAFTPTVTIYSNWKPCPRAEVLFTSFEPGTASVTVYREAEGREYPVSGAIRAVVAGALTRIDFEIPFNVSVTYWAEMFSAAGVSLGLTSSATVKLYSSETCIHNPLDPKGAVSVDLLVKSGTVLRRPIVGEVVHPIGRPLGVVISSGRQGLAGLTLMVSTRTLGEGDRFAQLLGDYSRATVPVLCIRSGTPIRIPKPLFASVLDPKEMAVDVHMGGGIIDWELTGDEVARPAPGLLIPLLTRADLNAYYSTRAALNADNASRLAVNRRYDLIGASNAVAL